MTQATEIYHEKTYIRKSAFIKACANAIADLNGEYPEDALSCVHDRSDGRSLEQILSEDEKFAYSDISISLDLNMDSHIYVYVSE